MYCPHCNTILPEKLVDETAPKSSDTHIPVQALSCPGCDAAILVDDRRGVIPIDAPIITILVVYR